jgi:peptidoglycan/xylan/chitin deacetylase (PgdA/CDA1 family)
MSTTTAIGHGRRAQLKRAISALPSGRAVGARALIYHRVGGGSPDERDLQTETFAQQLDVLADQRVLSLDDAMDAVATGDARPSVVVTFDDGFEDVFRHAWPLLRARGVPFTLYLTTAFVGGTMHWDGSTARDSAGPGLTWPQIREMVDSGLCTVGNHTHTHVRPEQLDADELDRCTEAVEREIGVVPRHFAYTWGVPVPRMETELRARFRSAATGLVGDNRPGLDPIRLRRVPVRGSDPMDFFRAKVEGNLWQERAYGAAVTLAKRVGARG